MIALVADEDFNGRILRGLLRAMPDINALTASVAGIAGQSDSNVIAWAAANGRIVLTHDVNTMIACALEHLRAGHRMSGLIAVPQQIAIGAAISDLMLIATCAAPEELDGHIWYLPL